MLHIEVHEGSRDEVEAEARLRAILDRWDLSKWLYTTNVRIDGASGRTFSHPILTLQPQDLLGEEEVGLSIFLHEQMHWAAQTLPGTAAAVDEARAAFPAPPGHDEGGAVDRESTWLHFVVCALHLEAMAEVLSAAPARSLLASHRFYRWIHATILGSEHWSSGYLRRHGLRLPPTPPPWEPAGTVVAIEGGPSVRLATGQPLERRVADELASLHGSFDLAGELRSPDVAVSASGRPSIHPVPTLGTRVAGDRLTVLAHYVELQHQWDQARRPAGPLPARLEALVPPARDERLPTSLLRAIVAACDATLTNLTALVGREEALRLTTGHPLNGDLYAALAAGSPPSDGGA